MKKFLLLIITALCLSGCSEEQGHPNKNDDTYRKQLFGGYYTVLENWERHNYIVYANDTKVKYIIHYSGSGLGMSPLYNTDGSLQIYEGE